MPSNVLAPRNTQVTTGSKELKLHFRQANCMTRVHLPSVRRYAACQGLVARFLAHWLSCMAAAWSLTVGTAALAEDTILLPGCREKKQKVRQLLGSKSQRRETRRARLQDSHNSLWPKTMNIKSSSFSPNLPP